MSFVSRHTVLRKDNARDRSLRKTASSTSQIDTSRSPDNIRALEAKNSRLFAKAVYHLVGLLACSVFFEAIKLTLGMEICVNLELQELLISGHERGFNYRAFVSLGVLTYFLLTGVSPFLAENKALTLSNITQMKIDYPHELFDSVSAPALAFIQALIKRNPRDRLTAIQCCQHEWLREQAIHEKDNSDEVKEDEIEVTLVEDVCAVNSGDDESISSSTSSSSTFSSPSRKRLALDDSENVEVFTQTSSKPPTALPPIPPIRSLTTECCFDLLPPRPVFPLEGSISRDRHQSRRRSILTSISTPATVVEATSPVD
ncbi:hypothetical protein Aperf_G00000064277 [Anoplocephala perfoliata]